MLRYSYAGAATLARGIGAMHRISMYVYMRACRLLARESTAHHPSPWQHTRLANSAVLFRKKSGTRNPGRATEVRSAAVHPLPTGAHA